MAATEAPRSGNALLPPEAINIGWRGNEVKHQIGRTDSGIGEAKDAHLERQNAPEIPAIEVKNEIARAATGGNQIVSTPVRRL
jgi:hypothetical protein